MNRRELFRKTALGAAGFAVAQTPGMALQFPSGYDASKELEKPDWKPVFLDEHQNATLIALSDLVIPETDTPGAKQALVNRFLDLLMSVENPDTQREFVTAMSYLDGACMERYKSAFIHITRDQQIEFLNLIAYSHAEGAWGEPAESFPAADHFRKLKSWIVGAFYSSPVGLKEIGWDGTFPHGQYAGCTHAAGNHESAAGSDAQPEK